MTTEMLYLGPVPCDEDCVQVGDVDFRRKATKEMNAYINQLYRMFPETESLSVSFRKRWENHDFGVYGEVVVLFDYEDTASTDFAYYIENNLPFKWDEEAIAELKEESK